MRLQDSSKQKRKCYGAALRGSVSLLLLLVASACFAQAGDAKQNTLSAADRLELQKVWAAFATAIASKNVATIKAMSTPCVGCVDCLTNTTEEDSKIMAMRHQHPEKWYDMMYGKLCFIDIGRFIRDDLPVILNEETKARLLDESKLHFVDNGHNRGVYDNNCIASVAERKKAVFAEVLVTVMDGGGGSEGMQKAFAFVKTGGSFKFCGYSTIP